MLMLNKPKVIESRIPDPKPFHSKTTAQQEVENLFLGDEKISMYKAGKLIVRECDSKNTFKDKIISIPVDSNASIRSMDFSPLGDFFVIATTVGSTFYKYTVRDFAKSAFKGHTDSVTFLLITQDNKYILSLSGDKTIKIWNSESAGLLRTIDQFKEGIRQLALTPDNERLGVLTAKSQVCILDLEGKIMQLSGNSCHQ